MSKSALKRVFGWGWRLAAAAVILAFLAGLFFMRSALYHRWVRFPQEAAAWSAIRADRQPVAEASGWNEYRGLLFYAHPEEPRVWDRPELHGMEIYNLHANFKEQRRGIASLLSDLWLNQDRYPDQVSRLIFSRPTANLQRWDRCNRSRHLTGIAGNDCHQNVGLRGFITPSGILRIEDTSPATLADLKLNAFTRALARLCLGPLHPGRRLFQVQLDPYERMTRFVATHVLARELTEPAILESLKMGRAFVGFDMLADSTGFIWLVQNPRERAIMGETWTYAPNLRFRAAAPHACRFTVLRDGERVCQQPGRTLDYVPAGPGAYRVEAELRIRGEWVPWIYSNPIWLRPP